MNVGTLLLACGVAFIGAFLLVWRLSGTVVLALPLGVLAGAGPPFVLNILANRRVAKFEEQFPEAIDLMSRALRAGHAFTTALSMVGEELPDPVGGEFKLAYDRQNFGMPLPDALRSLGARVPLIDARFFVTAVLTQREVGGNLSEVLENLAEVIRERFKVKRQVRVVTAHGRMTAWVLGSMPPVLAGDTHVHESRDHEHHVDAPHRNTDDRCSPSCCRSLAPSSSAGWSRSTTE